MRALFFGFVLVILPVAVRVAQAQERPAPAAQEQITPEQIAALIQQLGAEDYFVRQEAQDRLLGLGLAALDQLVQAAEQSDLEVAARARFLLRKIRIPWHDPSDPEPVARWMREYGKSSTTQRIETIRRLGFHYEGQGLAPLCRIVRFESDQGLSQLAAVLALRYPRPGAEYRRRLAKAVQKHLQGTQRTGAVWLRQAVQADAEGKWDAKFWATAIEQQTQTYQVTGNLLLLEVLQQLLEFCWSLPSLAGSPEVQQAAEKAIAVMVQQGAEHAGESLALWLLRHRRWEAWDRLWPRLRETVRNEPLMIYAAAAVAQRRGRRADAQKLLQKVRQMSLSSRRRNVLADQLRAQQLFDWAAEEYRRVFEGGRDVQAVIAALDWSQMLADLQRYDEAAQVAQLGIELLKRQVPGIRADAVMSTFQARQWFWQALAQEKKQGRPNVQLLIKAVQTDLSELDAIIALYRAARRPETKQTARQFIQQALMRIERAIPRPGIRLGPGAASPYNQWAWLVSNTEGDYEKAKRYSQYSLQLAPRQASYLDTLGRCYYALQRYEDAVVVQRLAVRLEPYYQQMRRQLQLFEKALAEQQSGSATKNK